MSTEAVDKLTFSTGIDSFDDILNGLIKGDNVVWQVDHIDDYIHFLLPFCRRVNEENKPLVYFRFAQHEYLLPDDIKVDCRELDPHAGFELFISEIFTVIEEYGIGACYVFDSLSELSVDWYSDRMLGNFFMLTCPYLYDYDTIAYFMLSKKRHTPFALDAIQRTAQVVLDLYRGDDAYYILPVKVDGRYSESMYMLHKCTSSGVEAETLDEGRGGCPVLTPNGDENNVSHYLLTPVRKSIIVAEVLSNVSHPWIDCNIGWRDTWTEILMQAQRIHKLIKKTGNIPDSVEKLKTQLIRMMVTREKRLAELCEHYFDLANLICIGKRIIGTGLIGGKAAGMLLGRIILKKTSPEWECKLETHDSFYIASDVYYSYIIENNCWWECRSLKKVKLDFDKAENIRMTILSGTFRNEIIEQFREMLNYFGQSPIIVRSSSLLEDAYGNAFSGKYESVFCANQGTPEERLKRFIDAVRTVYASTLSRDALAYREHNNLLQKDEQMALLVQRVSGEFYDHIYFPHLAGVGYSFNPFVWNSKIKAEEGVLRLVFGLGTHAVDRVGDDYTRIVAINEPLLRPENSFDALSKYSQKMVDLIDLKENVHTTRNFESVYGIAKTVPWKILTSRNEEMEQRAKNMGIKNIFSHMLTFDELLSDKDFLNDMRNILKTLENAYTHPVDIEFSVNFIDEERYRINILQCRPFHISKTTRVIKHLDKIDEQNILMKSKGPFIGQSVFKNIDSIIYIMPDQYSEMNTSQRYSVARIIGELSNSFDDDANIMLIGPGRWGTSMPELGVPVSFSEIRNVSVLCELVMMHEGLIPDISLGTHFFNDLVEMDILYMAFFPSRENYIWNRETLETAPSSLLKIKPEAKQWEKAIRVIDPCELRKNGEFLLHVDTLKQNGVLYLNK
jgi:pyruvate, water dikinase